MGGGLRSHQAYYCKQKRLKFLENDKFLTSGKTLALNDVLHVPNIQPNPVLALLGKVGVEVSFESDKMV